MNGKWLAGAIVAMAVLAGAALWYLQVYYYYTRLDPGTVTVELTSVTSGQPEPILVEAAQAIDAISSPIRYRACFRTPLSLAMLTETYHVYDDPEPLTGPGWFGCYDAGAIAEALAAGRAVAFLGQADLHYGIDRVVVVDETGQGWVWHQINRCGVKVFDGDPPPEDCPEPPAGTTR